MKCLHLLKSYYHSAVTNAAITSFSNTVFPKKVWDFGLQINVPDIALRFRGLPGSRQWSPIEKGGQTCSLDNLFCFSTLYILSLGFS